MNECSHREVNVNYVLILKVVEKEIPELFLT